ncbi:hypothetical protein HYH03_012847 [Edaphochlamys debaryana]|uniref:phytol kinase n=1 Tax=Edaphochlamys debaryana TaxID=47281 RepID=A0A835XRY6_9CHLO|nr:hypothetical protein HYH03_012847 [Edaphochlamys debaryana]|eukprot:KAG2488527.1 hypothetical protein HYH03_012847 [Edaphochlamys debaryana]
MAAPACEAVLPEAIREACTAIEADAECLLRPLLGPEPRSDDAGNIEILYLVRHFLAITGHFGRGPDDTPPDLKAAERTAATLLSRPAFRQALHLTLSVGARWPIADPLPADPTAGGPAADPLGYADNPCPFAELTCSACDVLDWLLGRRRNARDSLAVEVCRRLVRAQTLHALAGRLAELTSHLRRHAGPSAPAPLPDWAEQRLVYKAASLLGAVTRILRGMLRLSDGVGRAKVEAVKVPGESRAVAAGPESCTGGSGVKDEGAEGSWGPAAGPTGPATEGPAAQAGQQEGAEAEAAAERAGAERCFVQELSRALRESCVVEHCSATLLALLEAWGRTQLAVTLPQPGAESPPQGRIRKLFDDVYVEYRGQPPLQGMLIDISIRALAGVHKRLLGQAVEPGLGPCSFYAVISRGLAVLACLDGGPTHGLREELAPALIAQALPGLEWMQLEGFRIAAVPPDVTSLDLSCEALQALETLLVLPRSAGRLHFSRRAEVQLATRLAALALTVLASRSTAEGRSKEGRAGQAEPLQLAALAGGHCSVVVSEVWAEVFAVSALRRGHFIASAAGEGPSAPPLLDAAWWRLVAGAALHVRGMHLAETVGEELLGQLPRLPSPMEPLPPSPPPALAAALEGGVLPCLERLFRRAASDPGGREEATIVAFLDHIRHASFSWLLGPLAYGDVRQAAALVRTISKALERVGSLGLEGLEGMQMLSCNAAEFLKHGRQWLGRLAERRRACSGVGGSSGSAGGSSGCGGGALTAPERQLVGMLAAAVASWLPALLRPTLSRSSTPAAVQMIIVMWIPVLMGSTGAEAAAGTELAETGTGGGAWRRFAVSDLDGVHGLDTALYVRDEPGIEGYDNGRGPNLTLEGCLALATACPDLVYVWDSPSWPPQDVRALAPKLRAAGHPKEAGAAEALAAQLVRWTRGAGARGAGRGSGGRALSPALASYLREWSPRLEAAAALLPPSPAAALQALGGCSNPACANLEGDSEAGLVLRACAGCGGAASYCRRECQVAHWRAGHKEACGVRG